METNTRKVREFVSPEKWDPCCTQRNTFQFLFVLEPLPMRLRALPQSFWQQPNNPTSVSPANAYPILPPLINKEGDDDQEMDGEYLECSVHVLRKEMFF